VVRDRIAPGGLALATGAVLLLILLDAQLASIGALGTFAVAAYLRRAWWLAACAAAWALAFVAVLVLPGPYDSWAGRAAIPVLAGYALCFLGGWALGRTWWHRRDPSSAATAGQLDPIEEPRRPELSWPSERRLRAYLLALLVIGVAAALIRYGFNAPPLLADNPDAARAAVRARTNIYEGLLAEAWTLGMAVSLLRALVGNPSGRLLYVASTMVFTVGAALGASKNSILVGIVPGVIAALSVRPARRSTKPVVSTRVVVAVGLVAVAAVVYLGGQRTLAGTGVFENEFRARYGNNPVAASAASLDLSLSSSTETFGRLWAQRDEVDRRYGAYSLMFLGSRAEPIVGKVDLYAITAQLSMPYYMNTATFVAIPLLDFGPIGAAVMLLVLGLGVGVGERRLQFSHRPAQHVGRAILVYFAAFGIYELYPAIYPTWLALVPGLWVLYRLGKA
jgi:hypothetical protein